MSRDAHLGPLILATRDALTVLLAPSKLSATSVIAISCGSRTTCDFALYETLGELATNSLAGVPIDTVTPYVATRTSCM